MIDRRQSLERAVGSVSRETFDSLIELERQLIQWNRRINLVSTTTVGEAWQRHIIDSAQLIPLAGKFESWADLGSGGGFPGLVIGVFAKQSKGPSATLIESNSKKTAFLHHITGLFGLPINIRTERIENAVSRMPPPQIITARALASLPVLLDMTAPWLKSGSRALFHKGRDYRKELEESADKFEFDLIEHSSKVDPNSIILEIANLRDRS